MITKKKISIESVEQVADIAVEISRLNEKFQELYKMLNQQERVLVGSVAVAVESPYAEVTQISFMGDESSVAGLIDRLTYIFRNRNQVPPNQWPKNIIHVDGDPTKKIIN